jgi:ATP:ADP antiporter, AAA family
MRLPGLRQTPAVAAAMVCSGVVTAQFIAGKATRDALYLAYHDITTLPAMVIVTSVVSILLVVGSSKGFRMLAPAVFVPLAFAASAGLLLGEWALFSATPTIAARVIYLQISGIGPMLGSGFWLVASERFDPRTAKMNYGRIAGAGTFGGLIGGLVSERVAASLAMSAMLPILAAMNLLCAWLIRRLAISEHVRRHTVPADIAPELSSSAPQSGLRALANARYLGNLAALVLLGTAGAALLDYVFKLQATSTFGRGDGLLRFFAIYYAATSLLTFVVQITLSKPALGRLGLAASAATPSIAVLAGSAAALAAPGLAASMAARGAETVFRGSLFRAGYEIFYTPIPASEKRSAKSLIDVGFDRLGDAVGGGLVRMTLMLAPIYQLNTILSLAIGCALASVVVARGLHRGYIHALERSLLNRGLELELSEVEDSTTRTAMVRTLTTIQMPAKSWREAGPAEPDRAPTRALPAIGAIGELDSDLLQILALRSRDRERVRRALHSDRGLPAIMIPHVIPLLAWDPVAADAADALRRVAEERIGELVDSLIDPNQDFAVRRRLARVFSTCVSQRAADGAILGLDDQRFEVRFQCARSLVAIVEKNPRVKINRDLIFEVVRLETAVGRPVWEGQRLLSMLDDQHEHVFVDEYVKDRASRSLAHVFTLLSLALPPEPLRIAFRGLHTDDPRLRGTALEYLEGVLPPRIREQLWPFLEDRRPAASRETRPRDEILADLLRSHESIMINLEELQRRAQDGTVKPWPTT